MLLWWDEWPSQRSNFFGCPILDESQSPKQVATTWRRNSRLNLDQLLRRGTAELSRLNLGSIVYRNSSSCKSAAYVGPTGTTEAQKNQCPQFQRSGLEQFPADSRVTCQTEAATKWEKPGFSWDPKSCSSFWFFTQTKIFFARLLHYKGVTGNVRLSRDEEVKWAWNSQRVMTPLLYSFLPWNQIITINQEIVARTIHTSRFYQVIS